MLENRILDRPPDILNINQTEMKRFVLTLTGCVMSFVILMGQSTSQPTPQDLDLQYNSADPVKLFEILPADDQRAPDVSAIVSDASFLKVVPATFNEVRSEAPEFLALQIPMGEEATLELSLYKVDVLAEGFRLRASSSPSETIDYQGPVHYRGIIKGDQNSLAAVSILDGEVMGLASAGKGNIVIGQSGDAGDQVHIIYNDKNLLEGPNFECGTPDDGRGYTLEELKGVTSQRDVGDCVNVYIEIDDDIVSQKGGAGPATDYVTGLFNESITLYAWDEIEMAISEILAWDTPAPYTGGTGYLLVGQYPI